MSLYLNYRIKRKIGLLCNSITYTENQKKYNIKLETKDPDWWRKIEYNYQLPKESSTE